VQFAAILGDQPLSLGDLVFENSKTLGLNPLKSEIRDTNRNDQQQESRRCRPDARKIRPDSVKHKPMVHAGSSWFLDVPARIPEDGTGTIGRPDEPDSYKRIDKSRPTPKRANPESANPLAPACSEHFRAQSDRLLPAHCAP